MIGELQMKDLLKSNIYEGAEEIIIVGSCLKVMQPQAYEQLERMGLPIFDLCLEQTHVNMAITKVLGLIRAKGIKKIIFASVDRSPHCIQLHYIQDEIRKIVEEKYYILDKSCDEIRQDYKFDVSCQGTMPAAIQCFW